ETHPCVQRASHPLWGAGFPVESFRPEGLEEARQLWRVLFVDGAAMLLRQAYQGREAEMYSIVREIIEAAAADPPLTAERLFETLAGRDILRARFLDQMERYPILLCPVNAVPAFRTAELSWPLDGKKGENPAA